MSTTTEETWIDVTPYIDHAELPEGCPLLWPGRHAGIYLGVGSGDEGITISWSADDEIESGVDPHEARVDLSTEIGFGIALRWGITTHGTRFAAALDMFIDLADDTVQLVWRHMEGKTTEADRLAVARAYAELR